MVHLKSQREIDCLRESANLVGQTLAEVARHIEVGATLRELDAVAEEYIRTQGGEPAFKGYQVGDNVFPNTLCMSVNDAVVHGIPDDYALQDGDLLSIDCGAKLNGYYGDWAYTFAIGDIAEEDAALCRATHRALLRGIEQAVAGQRVGDISHAVQSHCESQGFSVVRDLVGHGVGQDLHEDPQVPNFGDPGRGRSLKPGLSICIEPMINRGTARVVTDDDGWTVRAADGLPSAHYEHMVVVRDGEPEVLSDYGYIEDVIDPPYEADALTETTTR
ncbi:type I methionyl aminopeptidase [Salinibacter ruber]|uniref:type I methionyl aminopeptidase n=1 Tax=Salinibacter ruber TaxID=146919 RepID=UPI0021687343|nr:type I methionyl aminopeptidase [Salinibacter ruber]MCS3702779.1 methionyl aminopeptidase [Salinibacter ruber]